jgi:hypothetical protein
MEVKEADFQKIVISIAKASGWLVHHPLPSMNRRGIWATHELGDHGFPDLVLALLLSIRRQSTRTGGDQP